MTPPPVYCLQCYLSGFVPAHGYVPRKGSEQFVSIFSQPTDFWVTIRQCKSSPRESGKCSFCRLVVSCPGFGDLLVPPAVCCHASGGLPMQPSDVLGVRFPCELGPRCGVDDPGSLFFALDKSSSRSVAVRWAGRPEKGRSS